MPFYIRKSVSAGPFRFNFSKAGVGVSVGVRGLRIGTGPRGHYIHAGIGGLYYRSTVRRAGRRGAVAEAAPQIPRELYNQNDVAMVEIESGDVIQMRDETFGELLDEINEKNKQVRMSAVFCWTGIVFGLISGLASGGIGLVLVLLGLPGFLIGRWLDSYRRSTVLYYDLEGDAEDAYQQLARGFDGLLECAGKWHIEAGGAVPNLTVWKRNAGASHLVKKNTTNLSYLLPSVIKSNVTPPALGVGKQTLFFLPDIVLVQDGSKYGAVPYGELTLNWQSTRFIEEGRVPSDASIVGNTWKHPNKNGGPDRRFRDNRQIPICLYETVHFQSSSGVNELVEFSRTGKTAAFAEGCDRLSRLAKEKVVRSLPVATPVITEAPKEQQKPRKHHLLRTFLFVVLAILVSLTMLGILLPSPTTKYSEPVENGQPDTGTATDISSANRVAPIAFEQTSGAAGAQSQRASVSPPGEATPSPKELSPPPSIETGPPGTSSTGRTDPNVNIIGHTRSMVNLRDGPNARNKILGTVPKNAAVRILRQDGNWSYVDVGNGSSGWIANKLLTTD